MRYLLACILMLMLILTGCGGRSRGEAELNTESETIRQIQNGDIVRYSIINGTLDTGTNIFDAYATVESNTCASEIAPRYGGRALKMVMEIEITLSNPTTFLNDTYTVYLEQASSGTIYEVGAKGGDGQVLLTLSNGNPVLYRSPVAIDDSYSYSANYSDGSHASHNAIVNGIITQSQ